MPTNWPDRQPPPTPTPTRADLVFLGCVFVAGCLGLVAFAAVAGVAWRVFVAVSGVSL